MKFLSMVTLWKFSKFLKNLEMVLNYMRGKDSRWFFDHNIQKRVDGKTALSRTWWRGKGEGSFRSGLIGGDKGWEELCIYRGRKVTTWNLSFAIHHSITLMPKLWSFISWNNYFTLTIEMRKQQSITELIRLDSAMTIWHCPVIYKYWQDMANLI